MIIFKTEHAEPAVSLVVVLMGGPAWLGWMGWLGLECLGETGRTLVYT